ncbi:MAG: HDOD domain-containing protein [Gammaproteobacteria bacterium]|nr:HDOD domain-containing protein [Gammaproteobacteria bacterium]MDH5652590.1 HDOD domain-containing protein [Gammaproteobacteria bacterium]
MGTSLEQQLINELLEDLENDRLVLPTLPEVALKVRDTLEDDSMGLPEVAQVITSDTALSARLIQIANSPLLRASRQIETVESAVTRMGGDMVRNLVMSIVMEQMFQATTDATDKRLRALWEHSTSVAAISHALAAQFTDLKPDQALLAGLVHDIGSLPILTRAEDAPALLADEVLLDKIISQTHTEIGKAILTKWNFPQEIIDVAEYHEDLNYHSVKTDYVDVVIVANLQSHLGTNHLLNDIDWRTVPSFDKLGIQADVNVIDMEGTGDEIKAIKSVIS